MANGLFGGSKGYVAPLSNYLGGGERAPPPSLSLPTPVMIENYKNTQRPGLGFEYYTEGTFLRKI